jgi:hypothetical protein
MRPADRDVRNSGRGGRPDRQRGEVAVGATAATLKGMGGAGKMSDRAAARVGLAFRASRAGLGETAQSSNRVFA